MMKATLRSAVLLGLLATSLPAFAEVQNVKVGGDITARTFYRRNLDLTDQDGALDGDNFLMSTTGINVGADLTENVSAFVRLANERDWDNDAANNGDGDFDLSQSYVTLKELFYSPLTVRVGTQPIVWGRGFVLGSALIPSVLGGDDRNSAITANEYTDFTAFDAIRATLDLSNLGGISLPLTADYVYIKLDENGAGTADDVTLQGVNFSTKLDQSEFEGYFLNKLDKAGATTNINKNGSTSVFGVRGSTSMVEGLAAWGELAYQFGQRGTDADTGTGVAAITGTPFHAWAFDLGTEYTFANVAMTPRAGMEWIFWSGTDSDGAIAAWDPIARSYFTTAIREFQTASASGFYGTDQNGDTSAATNQSQWSFWGGAKPVEDLNLTSRLSFFWQSVGSVEFNVAGTVKSEGERHKYAGVEWDNQLQYNYTDDVQFGLLWANFWPGAIYSSEHNSNAQQLVSTVSVKF